MTQLHVYARTEGRGRTIRTEFTVALELLQRLVFAKGTQNEEAYDAILDEVYEADGPYDLVALCEHLYLDAPDAICQQILAMQPVGMIAEETDFGIAATLEEAKIAFAAVA